MPARRDSIWFMAGLLAWSMACPAQVAVAQFKFLQTLLQPGRPAAGPRFAGHAQLATALQQAERGDIDESLKSVRDAFQDGGAKTDINDPDEPAIAQILVRLCSVWRAKHAPPNEVSDVLMDIVLPPKAKGPVFLYPVQWPLMPDASALWQSQSTLPAVESVSAELVRWTVLADQTDELRERLEPKLNSAQAPMFARIVAVQLAVREKDPSQAIELLEALTAETPMINGSEKLELLCHAVMPAVRDDEAERAGLALFEAVLQRADDLPQESRLKAGSIWLRMEIARRHLRAGRPDEAARSARLAAARPWNDRRYGDDYVQRLQRMQVERVVAVLLEGGLVQDALELIGPYAEAPDPLSVRYNIRQNLAAMLGRELQKLPAAARLKLLREWAIPRGDQPALRELTDFVPLDEPTGESPLPRCGLLQDIYSTSWHMLVTAQELGQLEDVLQDLAAAAVQTPRIRTVRLLGAILRDGTGAGTSDAAKSSAEITSRLKQLLEETIQNLPKWSDAEKTPFPMLTFAVASEAARQTGWRPVAMSLMERLIEHTQVIQWDRPRAHLRMAHMELLRMRDPGNLPQPSWDEWARLRPQHWVDCGIQTAAQHASGSMPDIWCAWEGGLQHLTGSYDSDLSFEYPLSGQFEIAFDSREGGWAEGTAGYGGVHASANAYSNSSNLFGEGRVGYDQGPNMARLLHHNPWNHFAIQVDNGVVRYRANGQLVHVDEPGSSAPWLTLGADWGRIPVFRNLRLTGTPVILRDVPLITDPRLRGWIATHFQESQPNPIREPRRMVQTIRKVNGQDVAVLVDADELNAGQGVLMLEPETDWRFSDGELRSPKRGSFWPEPIESWMYYQRPLRDGESLRYEFFYAPGTTDAMPTIGRQAYGFSAEGVTRRRITDGSNEVFATPAAGGVLEARPLMLQEHDWNSVEISLRDNSVAISLNGDVVTTEKINPTETLQFGFYHDAAQTSLRVRNAVLTGNWPQQFDERLRQAIEWPEPTQALESTRFFGIALSEELISDNAYEIYRRALRMDVNQRYEFLRRWVLPNSSHDLLRMAGAFTPTHPAPPVLGDHPIDVATAEARQAVEPRMVQTGGNFVCPAVLLVLAAMETDRIEELKEEIQNHPPGSSLEMARSRAAILGIIALLEDRIDDANGALWECSSLISEQNAQGQYARWGDVAFASLAVQHPATQAAAYELLDRIRKRQLQSGKPGTREFGRFVRQLHNQAEYLMSGGQPDAFGAPLASRQWKAVSQPSAKSRGNGYPIASFDTFTGDLALRGGHDVDMAYFQSPLRGNYEVNCRLSQFDYREAMMMAAGIANSLSWTHTSARVLHVRSPIVEVPTPQPIAPRNSRGYDFRIVVRDGRYASYVNGQQIHQADLPENSDPWLAMMGLAGHSSRYARNIVITGDPEIPDELDLLAPPDLKGWITDYYGNEIADSPFAWTSQDGVLSCDQSLVSDSVPGRLKIENIIHYHRPLLEDGEITYEFFYDPEVKQFVEDPNRRVYVNGRVQNPQREIQGQTTVAPALDRLVCLLEPDGVKIHWLTDGRFERTGLFPGNAEPVVKDPEKPTPLPLKVREWNAVKFAVQGDTLSITLNGELVLTREIEPTNLRRFGLFHYVNESGVRVRNIRYRGDWPKHLPAVDEQELGRGPEGLAILSETDLPASQAWDFTNSKFAQDEFEYHWDAAAVAQRVHPEKAGLRFDLPAGMKKVQYAGLHPKLELAGDFSITIEYASLKTTVSQQHWGAGLELKVHLDQNVQTGLQARDSKYGKAWRAVWHQNTPLNDASYDDESIPGFAPTGRARLQRRGPVLYYFIAESDSDQFRLVSQRPVGTSDVRSVLIEAVAADDASGAEFVLKNLSIYAEQIRKR